MTSQFIEAQETISNELKDLNKLLASESAAEINLPMKKCRFDEKDTNAHTSGSQATLMTNLQSSMTTNNSPTDVGGYQNKLKQLRDFGQAIKPYYCKDIYEHEIKSPSESMKPPKA